jgi:release factor glutamine methyltransferase
MERVLEVSRKAAGVLQERGLEQPRLDAELLLAGVLGVKRLDLYLQHDRPLTPDELARYRAAVRRRLRREPLQYILGTAPFRHLELHVDPRVLIPRPETELLAGEVLAWATSHGRHGAVLDIGTGSGAIALSLAREGTFSRVVASDVSPDALDVARSNAQRLGIANVEFRSGSLFDVVCTGEAFDVIVSNPPYVAEDERHTLTPEVAQYEPATALYGGADGWDVLRLIVSGACGHITPGGLLALEIGAAQGSAVLDLIATAGGFDDVRVLQDLSGRDRMVLAQAAG